MKPLVYLVLLFIISITCSTCLYNKEDILYAEKSCDTTNITFSGKVAPVFARNCLVCHGNAVSPPDGGGLRLQDYPDVRANITRAYGSMSHKPGFVPMPLGMSGTIDSCEIKIVRIWMNAGMPDN
jgi:hypothetical protein